MRPFLFFLGATVIAATTAAAPAAAQQWSSGPGRTSLIELYTSEGCSSCPPAERWLATLLESPGLWRDFVPVSFHVNYWDRLGWTDRFSSRAFTEREYAYASAWRSSSVYTPCFVRDGAEWHPHSFAKDEDAAAGKLSARYDGSTLRVEYAPAPATLGARADDYEVHAAILGGGIRSKIGAGENRGETLAHEFVALALAGGVVGQPIALAVPATAGVGRHALAVWVTRRGALAPLQATGGWLE